MIFWRHSIKQKQVMHEGRLLKSELLEQNGEKFYVERIAFKDWNVSLHNFYLICKDIYLTFRTSALPHGLITRQSDYQRQGYTSRLMCTFIDEARHQARKGVVLANENNVLIL